MVACAKFLGRDVKSCTRGDFNCLCKKELRMNVTESNDLVKENSSLKDILRQIGYPKRGTEEENMDIYEAANLIQSNFTLEQLS